MGYQVYEDSKTERVTEIRSQSDPLWVNDRVNALKRALVPDAEDLIFADGDIIAWRMPEMMTTETVHRTAVYLERRRLWFWGNGNVLGPIEKLLIRLRCEGVYRDWETDRKSTRLNSSHRSLSRMPSSA